MRTFVAKCDGSGNANSIGCDGVGFVLLANGGGAQYPVDVVTRSGDRFVVTGSHEFRTRRFQMLDIIGGTSNAAGEWLLAIIEDKDDRFTPSATKSRKVRTLQSATAVGTANPVDGDTSGFAVTPQMNAFEAYFGGTARDIDIYVQSKAGNWKLAEDDAVVTADFDATFGCILFRLVQLGAGRIYFKASGASCTVEIDVEEEV